MDNATHLAGVNSHPQKLVLKYMRLSLQCPMILCCFQQEHYVFSRMFYYPIMLAITYWICSWCVHIQSFGAVEKRAQFRNNGSQGKDFMPCATQRKWLSQSQCQHEVSGDPGAKLCTGLLKAFSASPLMVSWALPPVLRSQGQASSALFWVWAFESVPPSHH